MKKVIYDLETDGLLDTVSTVWCLVIRNIEEPTDVRVFTGDKIPEGLLLLSSCTVIAGHNIIGYDNVVLDRLYGWKPNVFQKVWDTFIMSQSLQYKRSHRHSLKGWGDFFGNAKGDYKDFTHLNQEMIDYCIQDTMVNLQVYNKLISDMLVIKKKNPLVLKGLEVECKFAEIEAEIQHTGWNFNMSAAKALTETISSKMVQIASVVEPKIGLQCIKKDKEPKKAKFKKDGSLFKATASDFDIEDNTAEFSVHGEYSRISFEEPNMGSIEVVKKYLYSLGWVPDEWNFERLPNGQIIKKSPKFTESSITNLPDGPEIVEYMSLRNRLGVLNGWIENASKDGRLHGRMWTVGTPTFRCRHEVIANLPGVDAYLGLEMRGLLGADDGWVLVGADSSGNQMRGLCHYMNNPDFTEEVVNGDVHQRNADILGISRKTAKSFLYAFLFGAGPAKLAQTAIGKRDAVYGKAMQEKFYANTPGLAELRDKLSAEWSTTLSRFGKEYAHIAGIDGRLIFVESEHQLLNYLLQTLEGITCKAAAVYLKQKLVEENIEHKILLHYHDEFAFQVRPKDKDRAMALAVESFTEAPKWFGVQCMSGAAQSGQIYSEIH